MPFGEEIFNGVGVRSPSLKYGSNQDGIRQKFTGYQKDSETNLDFAEARMYENLHGRFTAVDPLLASGKSANPQTFNRYAYINNSPIMGTDPSGTCKKGECPRDWTGTVYTKTFTNSNGSIETRYDNEKTDDTWSVFTGDSTITMGGADGGSGTFRITGGGWTEITAEREAIRTLLGGLSARS